MRYARLNQVTNAEIKRPLYGVGAQGVGNCLLQLATARTRQRTIQMSNLGLSNKILMNLPTFTYLRQDTRVTKESVSYTHLTLPTILRV